MAFARFREELDRRRLPWTLAALAASSLVILGGAPAQYLGRQHDDLMYALTAESLAEGRGFRSITSPVALPMTMLSPGLPLVLAPLAWMFPGRFGVLELACAVILSLSPWIFWLWLKARRLRFPEDILIVSVFATSPILLYQAGTVMSECLFTFLSLAFLLSLENPNRRTRIWGGGLSLMAAVQTRLAGVALFPAALIRPLLRRRWKEALAIGLAAAVPLFFWGLWSFHVSGSIQKIQEGVAVYSGAWRDAPLVALHNAYFYITELGASVLPPASPAGRWGGAVGFALALGALLGTGAWLKSDAGDPAAWVLIGAATLHLFWPWHYDRYWMMPFPFFLASLHKALKRWSVPAFAALLAAQVFFSLPARLRFSGPFKTPELSESYAWTRAHTPQGSVLASLLYMRDGFYSRRPSLPLALEPSSKALADFLKARGVRYVLWVGNLDFEMTLPGLSPVARGLGRMDSELKDKEFFDPVYENDRESSRLYLIR